MAPTTTPAKILAYRVTRGMTIRHERRTFRVAAVTPVVFYSRNRLRELAPSERNGVTLELRGTRSATVTFRNYDLITIAQGGKNR